MFSAQLKQIIADMVGEKYVGNLKRDIDLFEKSLSIKAVAPDLDGLADALPSALEELGTASLLQIKPILTRCALIEQFARHLFSALFPDRYATQPVDERGYPLSSWTLAPLLKQGLNVVPAVYNLTSGTPKTITFPYKLYYDTVYANRNTNSHGCAKMSAPVAFEVLTAFLIVYLDLSARFAAQIEKEYNKTAIDVGFPARQYCQKIVSKYNENVKNGFRYVNIKWKAEGSAQAEYSTADSIFKDTSNPCVKLLGEAGCGKTTILRRLEYLSAKAYLENRSSVIPVFFELAQLEKRAGLSADIKSMMMKQLEIPYSILEKLLNMNNLRLYLDGFNEVLNSTQRKNLAISIDELANEYPKLEIFLSDRSLVRSHINTLKGSLDYKLYPLDREMKDEFIKSNCTDERAKALLMSHLAANVGIYEKLNTPFRLTQLIELVSETHQIPENIEGAYITRLIERERDAKMDENAKYLETFCCALAVFSDEKLLSRDAEYCIGKCIRIFAYNSARIDSIECLDLLVEMGILAKEEVWNYKTRCEEVYYDFKYPEYKAYFWELAFHNKIYQRMED